MKYRTSSRLCRALVVVLLFNMLAPVVMASNETENGQTLLCTSAGLIKVSLTDFDSDSDNLEQNNTPVHGEHCPYCKFTDLPNTLQNNLPPYPAPDSVVALHYRSVLPTRASQHVVTYRLLRAPPKTLSEIS